MPVGVNTEGLEDVVDNFAFDDDESVFSFQDEDEGEVVGNEYGVLEEEAVNAQRLGVSRNAAQYMKGSAVVSVFNESRKWTDEKLFAVSKLIDWVEREPAVVVDMMRSGRVRARVSAAMGLGKSTKLPLYVAEQMGHRVLYVSLDSAAVGQVGTYVQEVGLGRFRSQWSTSVCSRVVAMTYSDFNAHAAMDTRSDLFKHFETVIFDEAFAEAPMVAAALKQFAVMALPDTNLLMSSANARVDTTQGVTSAGQGQVRVIDEYVSPQDAMASGKLMSDYLTDQTMLILPNDEVVHDVAQYYEDKGVDVKTLDTASRQDELAEVCSWLKGDSSTPRVLVAHHRFGIAFNIPVSYMILWPMVTKMFVNDGVVKFKDVPMTEAVVAQALSRLGRGIVDGAGALVMGPARSELKSVTLSEKIEEYFILAQSYIRVRDTEEWSAVRRMFPKQISPAIAQSVRKVNLPAEIAVRYLAEDGKFASKYARALQFFAQTDHYIRPSKHELPVGHDRWKTQKLFGSSERGPDVSVPVIAEGELQVVMHAVHAIAEGKITIEKWRLPRLTDYNGGSDSEDELVEMTSHIQRRRLRRVRSVYQPEVRRVDNDKRLGWSYVASEVNEDMGGRGSRRAVVLPRDRFTEAMKGLCKVVDSYAVPKPPVDFVEVSGGYIGQVKLPALSAVESPGGSLICEIPGELAKSLNTGRELSVSETKELVQIYRVHGRRLVASRLFDCYGHAWSAVYQAFMSTEVVNELMVAGLQTYAYEFLGYLGTRFSMELDGVVAKSNVYKRVFLNLFSVKPTTDQILRAIHRGKFDAIAQSEAFLDRVRCLKGWHDRCLLVAERCGVYLPHHFTAAQFTLPIHGATPIPHQAQGSIVMQPLADYYSPRKGMRSLGHSRDASGGSGSMY